MARQHKRKQSLRSEEMFTDFREHFIKLFGRSGGPDSKRDVTDYLNGLPRISERDVECCEMLITPEEVIETIANCHGGKALGLEGFLYELYKNIPDFFEHMLYIVYTNWRRNGFIPRSV